ncbi:MAG TPA: T9SS type A sorting domain-containing protein [Bacteroidia bacterium]|nr:T9SS type A sorting domain-containing protein [Bacteroidia bacterium]HNU34556.1 T9SS type A sorting domain-containing protein [Bacteroidia bacterium]
MKNLVISLLCLSTSLSFSQTWNTVGGGIELVGGQVAGMIVHNDKLWVVGPFNKIANSTIPSMGKAQWDSLNWIPDTNIFANGYPYTIGIHDNEVYIGGTFRNINGNNSCRRIAKWDGSQWLPLGKGITDGHRINVLQSYNGDLYVGGPFLEVDDTIPAKRIARWDGSQWHAMGTGFWGGFGLVQAMAVFNGELYVGGNFLSIDGVAANSICKWNGTTWSALGTGINGFVTSFTVDTINNILYIGGQFNLADTVNIPTGVAAWNGTSFSAVGTTPFLSPVTMCMYQNKLWVGGAQYNITNNLGDSINEVAWFNGTEWMPASFQSDHSEVEALVVYKNELYMEGGFDTLNNIVVHQIAKTYTPSLNTNNITDAPDAVTVTPNPADNKIEIKILQPYVKAIYWRMVNNAGKEIKHGKILLQQFTVDTQKLPEGVYFLEIFDGDNILKKEKIVIMH